MVDRIRNLCREKGTSITKLEQALGFGNGTIGKWKVSEPSHERLELVAQALGTTPEYLKGRDTKKEPAPSERDELISELYLVVNDLPPDKQAELLRYARYLAGAPGTP